MTYVNSTVPNQGATQLGVTTAIINPTDRIRWGPIWGGIFAALSTLILLSVLGAAIGLSAYDRGDSAESYGWGAIIWGAITFIIAFFLGGWLASRSSALPSKSSGTMNGAMVWAVTIPLFMYLLGSGLAGLLGTGIRTAGDVGGSIGQSSSVSDIGDRAQQASQQIGDELTAVNTERAADRGAGTAWGMLVSLLVGLGAASLGGYVGSRGTDDDHDTHDRDRDTFARDRDSEGARTAT